MRQQKEHVASVATVPNWQHRVKYTLSRECFTMLPMVQGSKSCNRTRGEKPMRQHITEAQIQAEVIQLLQKERIFCHSVPNEGAGCDMIRTTQLIALGLRKGVADLIVWWPDGIGYLEMKRPGGKQSKEQIIFEKKCKAYGVSYDLAHSVEEVREIIGRHRRKDD